MAMDLFDDAGEDDVEEISKIEINEDFAKRYEHNKKREDLQKLEEMKKKGLINDSGSDSESDSGSESDEDDDDDDDDVRKKEVEFFDALLKVRKKDPILKEKDAKLFESSSEGEDEKEGGDEKRSEKAKQKPKYLKDVMAQHLMEEGPEFEEEKAKEKVKTYAEEQEHLRESVLEAMARAERENDDGEGGDFLKLKEREEEDDDDEEGEEEIGKKLDEYFGEDEKLDENDKFLKDFFKNKLWMDKDKGKKHIDDDLEEISDDEEAIEQQEDYEREYNFRFEENKSDRVLSHSRFAESSVRKETNARKQQRERKKERLAQAEVERREEVKRLKNLKKREIQEKLDKIREIAGLNGDSIPLTEEDLEEEFDPDEFDKKMKAAFGDDYYEAEDADPGFGSDADERESDMEKPDFDKEDELLGLPKDWDVIKSKGGFFAEREKLKSKEGYDDDGGGDNDNDNDDNDQMETKEGKKKRKRKLSLKEKLVLDKELEELYKLDYEDAIGDLKTRFKYRGVAPRKYGLSAAHILWMDDKELNQYVSLKKLAPYSEKEWAVPRMHRQNMLKKGMLLQAAMNKQISGKRKRKRRMDLGEPSGEKSQGEQPTNDESKLSRAAKRRRRQKEKKLPQSRLAAYGKIPPSSKNKSKS